MKAARDLAAQALAITSQHWTDLGFSEDSQVAPSGSVAVITERIVSLLAIRSVAVLSTVEDFDDFSTTTICRSILLNESSWPTALTEEVIGELRAYVKRIVGGYNETPYHNREHAYHVVLSANKLLDIMLNPEDKDDSLGRQKQGQKTAVINGGSNHKGSRRHHPCSSPLPRTFGLRRDTLLQFTLVFAALIHDVKHGGISNRQLALEDDPLSLLYNDSSVLEQQSLTIAFAEFLQPEYSGLRKTLLPTRDIYSGFRQTVVNLVLATDIANPERMQITKDKWKTAFGDVDQAAEDRARRESAITEITLPRHHISGKESRRRSVGSAFSDITADGNIHDEAPLSATPESSDNDGIDYPFGSNTLSAASPEGFDNGSSDGLSGSHFPLHTPDSIGTRSLQKIEELERTATAKSSVANKNRGKEVVTPEDLGYSTHTKQNGMLSPKSEGNEGLSMSIPKRSKSAMTNRRGSTTNIPDGGSGTRGSYRRRRASVASCDNLHKRMQQRLSSTWQTSAGDTFNPKKFRQRLGIMRSLDLGGETIENFSRKSSICSVQSGFPLDEYDEPDELRAIVVLETMLLSCDVAHNLQSWDHMLKWSHRLYWELQDANEAGRGFDPSSGWVQGQAGFLQGYMLPLAKKLGGTGVFGGRLFFATIVEVIFDQWEAQGEEVTAALLSNRDLDHTSLFRSTTPTQIKIDDPNPQIAKGN